MHVQRKPVLVSLVLLHRSCPLGTSLVICTWLVQVGWTATWHTSDSTSALLWASCYRTRSTDVSLLSSIGQSVFKWHCCWSDQKCLLLVYLIGSTRSRQTSHPTPPPPNCPVLLSELLQNCRSDTRWQKELDSIMNNSQAWPQVPNWRITTNDGWTEVWNSPHRFRILASAVSNCSILIRSD